MIKIERILCALPFAFCLLTFSIFHQPFSIAEVRYVSKTGSSTPPYTTWETAADSIMEAINISSFGDTIYVANGVYKEQVIMIPGLALIGGEMDSCVIDTRDMSNPQTVIVNDYCLLKGFKIIVQSSSQTPGSGIIINGLNPLIEYNEVLNGGIPAIWCYDTNAIIRHNKILYCDWGIYIEFNQPEIDSNYFYIEAQAGKGINPNLGSNPLIRGNIIVLNDDINSTFGYWSGFNYGGNVQNNLFYSFNSDQLINSEQQEHIINNILIGNFNTGIWVGSAGYIKNNSITGGTVGIEIEGNNTAFQFQYNNVWNCETNFINHTPDSTNLSENSMFADEDSMDFHLQMYSPLIDAGDPSILDKDGTRSDIGLYGGPYGEKYTYRDLAPKPPSNLTATLDSGLVLLRWNRNNESDFFRYRIYRDTVPDFMYDTTKFITITADTFYYDALPERFIEKNYYYKITALDSAAHQSATSEEVQIMITGLAEAPPIIVEKYQLLNNYPNPFNPSTIIPYRLKEGGYVKLYVYDLKGELVRVLVNEYQPAGYYEIKFSPSNEERKRGELKEGWWTGYNDDIASGIYIYQIMLRGEGNIPVFTDIGKMILLK